MPAFNLLDQPWLPVATGDPGAPLLDMSLRDTLIHAPQLRAIDAPSPLTTVALYRLLLAFLHRALQGPRDAAAWQVLAIAGQFPIALIDAYCARWQDRFDLLDDEYPFFQSPSVAASKAAKSATQLTFSRASERNRPTLFDQSTPATRLSHAEAALGLVTTQAYTTGGFVSYDDIAHKSAKAAPLVTVGLWQRSESTLFATLLANLTPYVAEASDRPAWEQDAPAEAPRLRMPAGRCDWYTWQSRRLFLLADGDGVGQVITMKGDQAPDGGDHWHADPQVILDDAGMPRSPRGQSALLDLGLALDALPLLRDQTGDVRLTQTWVLTQQVKCVAWHTAYLVVPALLLRDRSVWSPLLLAARDAALALVPLLDGSPVTTPVGTRISPLRALVQITPQRSGEYHAAPLRYWAAVETQYRAFIDAIADGSITPATASDTWQQLIVTSVRHAFAGSLAQIPNAPRRVEEVAALRDQFNATLTLLTTRKDS